MKVSEWERLVQIEIGLWPHANIPDDAIDVQYEFVRDLPYDHGVMAVKALADEPYPPNSARIAQKALELATPAEPDFDEVAAAFHRIIRKGGGRFDMDRRPTAQEWGTEHNRIVEFFSDPGRWKLWCCTPDTDRTFYAQQRDEYRAVRTRWETEQHLLGAGVDRGALRSGELRRIDPAPELGSGAQ